MMTFLSFMVLTHVSKGVCPQKTLACVREMMLFFAIIGVATKILVLKIGHFDQGCQVPKNKLTLSKLTDN